MFLPKSGKFSRRLKGGKNVNVAAGDGSSAAGDVIIVGTAVLGIIVAVAVIAVIISDATSDILSSGSCQDNSD